MSGSQRILSIIGRVALSAIFLLSAYGKITNWHGTEQYMVGKMPPALVPFLLAISFVLELGGALLLLSGFKPRIGAVMLIIFLLPVTLIMHNFWAADPASKQMQTMNFIKNMAIVGGLLLFAVSPSAVNPTQPDAVHSENVQDASTV